MVQSELLPTRSLLLSNGHRVTDATSEMQSVTGKKFPAERTVRSFHIVSGSTLVPPSED